MPLQPISFIPARRGAVALMAALATPALLAAVAVGIELANWSAWQIATQRTADLAALAAGQSFASGATIEQAANAGATVAEANGAAGATARSWNAATNKLTDGAITVTYVAGVRSSSDPAFQATVAKSVPLTIARLISTATQKTLSASATGEVESLQSWGGPQPCVAALQTAAQGGTGLTYTGWTTMEAYGCSIRSNAGITETGSGGWNTQGIYAAGSVSIPFWVSDQNNTGQTVTPIQNDGTIPDPYAANAAVKAAFTAAANASGGSIACSNQHCGLPEGAGNGTFNGSYCVGQGTGSVSCTLQPGSYGSLSVTSGGPYYFTLQPGMYYFNGNINLSNYTVTNGSAVTIITSGTVTGANTFDLTLTAPTPAQAADTGGIAGLALAGNTTGTISVSGDPQVSVTGVVYFPNATFSGAGSTTVASSSCFEILAGSITLSGDSGYSGTCPQLGAVPFGSTYSSVSMTALVQ